jgi:hypothetical protein
VFEAPCVLTWIVSAAAAAGEIIGQLYAGEDTGMLHEPLKKIGFETLLNFYWFKDRSFEATEIKYGSFEKRFFE